MHNAAPVTNGGSDEVEVARQSRPGENNGQQNQVVSKWADLWRTMILSSLGMTLYPYCRYIRVLELRDLKELLYDPKFQNEYSDDFFAGALSQFRIETETPVKTKSRGKRPLRLHTTNTVEAIGEVITKQTPMLEEINGEISSSTLLQWILRLPKLQQMALWNGAALADGVGSLIHKHCPNFKGLRFYEWSAPEADSLFATFLQELRPETLKTLEVFSFSNIGAQSFLALNCHSTSLQELKLNNIKSEAMPSLSMLKGCTALTSLLLTEPVASTDLEHTQNDVFLEVISWLRECTQLHSITFQELLSGPAILTPILLENNINLVRLEVRGYVPSRAKTFHQALAHHHSLRSVSLWGDAEDCDIDTLVEALCQLRHLTDLHLSNLSDFFRDEHICKLARSLPNLEELFTSGWGITDAIWSELATLRFLRRLDINAWSMFTLEGILKYISDLGPGNGGLSLAIMMADPDSALSEEEQAFLREELASRAEGRFEYTLA